MRRLCFLSVLLIAGCAGQLPAPDTGACPAPPETTLLLTAEQGDTSWPPLVLRWQGEADSLRLVALDTLGSLQFSATMAGPHLEVRGQNYYRGPDPATLISAVYWWLLRDRLSPGCTAAAGLTLERNARQTTLRAQSQPVWQWYKHTPDSVTLPGQNITLNMRINKP